MTINDTKRPVGESKPTGRDFLNQYVKQEKVALRSAVIAGSFSTVLLICQWLAFVYIAQAIIIEQEPISSQTSLLLALLGFIIGRTFLTRIQTHFSQQASLNIRNSIRKSILTHWRLSSPMQLKNTSTGAFASQFVEEVESMDGYFSNYWPQQALAIISPLLILCAVGYLNWLSALLLFISAPLIPLFMILVGMGAEALNQKYSTLRQRLAGHFLDRVAHLSTILQLGGKKEVFAEVESNSERYRDVVMKTLKVAFLSSTVLEFFTSIAIAMLAIFIGFSLYGAITWGPAESLTLFSGLTILILAPEFFQPLRNLSQFYHDRASALGAANNLVESLLYNVDNAGTAGTADKYETNHRDIQTSLDSNLNNYSVNSPHLKLSQLVIGFDLPLTSPLNWDITASNLVAISGDSGSGKTTLLNTLAGFMPALSGSMTHSIKSSIAYLPQKPWIKNNTIYENLKALAPNATRAEMTAALDQLGLLDELAAKHLGLDTLIGEHGKGLSGGQMQRMAFARVLLNPTPIIIFDEPTAQLDLHSKALIYNALKILKDQRILIIASHDPLLIEQSDFHIKLGNIKLGKV